MDERVTRLHTHLKNIDRYQGLLATQLSEAEKLYLEKRLSEERFAIIMLQFMSSPAEGDPAARNRPGEAGAVSADGLGS